MFVFLAVPGLLVVVAGYVVGFAVADWVCGLLGARPGGTPELAGWLTGLLLLAVVLRLLLVLHRRRSKDGGHQK
ncbi:hypothetical protein SAMN04515665_11137 [Blastococcus sp. DSM 46786]|uniref:hypothetical protein n=1 Tax=Blastococcus sp. DSM 46786 TaxID=1798227 RepID=UPI0008D44B9E|nr:hypothetical protein [Blastococcus sp. DSM 46786]SEL32166.1 hypothetical protein SAMN04515665_11137 [Blastococcus sp. DSM 46786]